MHEIDEPVEEDDTSGDVLLVRADEVLDDAVERMQRQVRGDASGIRTLGDEWHLVKEVTCGSDPDDSPANEAVESISDRVQRQVGEALLVLDAVADEITAVGLSLVEVGGYLSDEDHDLMLHEATELAGLRRKIREAHHRVTRRKYSLSVRSG